jgi:hypothetical protein
MRYFCLFLILFLSACAPAPVKRAPANSISEAEYIASRENLTPMEQRQLLLSTPYIIELLPSFEGIVFSNEKYGVGTDIKECVDFGLTYDVNHNQFVQEYIAQKEIENGGAGEVVASGAAAVGAGALAAGILAIALLGPIAGSLGASGGAIAGLGTAAATGVASSLAATIGPIVLLSAIAAESERSSISDNVSADSSIKTFVLKSTVIKCLTEKGYSFDIYASLVLSNGANIESLDEKEALQFFEIYGDLAVAEYQTIINDIDPYITLESDNYYTMSEYEKVSFREYLKYLKERKQPLRVMNKDVALEASKIAQQEAFVFWDPLSQRFIFTKQQRIRATLD